MNWYLVHTKPRQEKCALQNLEQQGYEAYLPTLPTEKLCQGTVIVVDEPLFPRYLFIRLDPVRGWSSIRSTKGVSRLVSFGVDPAKVDQQLVDLLKAQEHARPGRRQQLFVPGERVRLAAGAFAGIEGIYQMADGESRVMVLIELLSRPLHISISPANLRKVG